MKVEICQSGGFKVPHKYITQLFNEAEKVMPRFRSSEVSIAFVGNSTIKSLNKRYRRINKVTDVLSFSEKESRISFAPKDYLGEIVICYPRAKQQARENKHSIREELAILLAHGFLHLIGYDHGQPKEARKMKKWERKILNKTGTRGKS
ncbi:rRNA maturation RNase YbeY [Patescibacteria group bacterium]|nr:rRNA maturation RNase YbeY [Patescibacteria group bacterium]MBU0964125.1 rRNA maturation RNase YbeY [Patescibacteria group bacterium]